MSARVTVEVRRSGDGSTWTRRSVDAVTDHLVTLVRRDLGILADDRDLGAVFVNGVPVSVRDLAAQVTA